MEGVGGGGVKGWGRLGKDGMMHRQSWAQDRASVCDRARFWFVWPPENTPTRLYIVATYKASSKGALSCASWCHDVPRHDGSFIPHSHKTLCRDNAMAPEPRYRMSFRDVDLIPHLCALHCTSCMACTCTPQARLQRAVGFHRRGAAAAPRGWLRRLLAGPGAAQPALRASGVRAGREPDSSGPAL